MDSDDSVIPDNFDKVYQTGLTPTSNEILRGIPALPKFRAFLPISVDLSGNMPRPGDQGSIGSCAAWAVGYAARGYYTWVAGRRTLAPENLVSPNYLYNAARTKGCDDGSSLAENVRVLQKGAVSMRDYPYRASCDPIPPTVQARATDFQVNGFSRIVGSAVDDIRGQLATGVPVVLSMKVTSNFHKLRGSRVLTGDADLERPDETSYHAVVAVGYDDTRQALKIINSWGRGWGEGGYGWIGYELASKMIREAMVLSIAGFSPEQIVKPDENITIEALVTDLNSRTCGNVSRRDSGDITILSGYVGSREDLDKIEKFARSRPNVRTENLVLAPWPQCELRKTLETALAQADKPAIALAEAEGLVSGKGLEFQVRAPEHFSYLYVSYVQADQTVVHLVQPKGAVAPQTIPTALFKFGDGQEGRQKFTVSAPFGREAIFVVASRSPLFDKELPQTQQARDYLSALRRALIYRPDAGMAPRVVAASMTEFETRNAP